jgi:cathepsin D
MAPVYLALALLFFPTAIFSEPLHVPLRRRQTLLKRDLNQEANKLRVKYGYQPVFSLSHRSNRRAVAGIPLLDQVDIVIVSSYSNSSQE